MDKNPDAVYNLTRRKLLNDKLTVSDCASQPLKMLSLVVSGPGLDSESALWLYPLHAAPGLPRVFPFDLLYLDKDYRVLEIAAIGPGIAFPSYRSEVTSALVLPEHTLDSTDTKKGDRLMICSGKELQTFLAEMGSAGSVQLRAMDRRPPKLDSPGEHLPAITQNTASPNPAISKPPAQVDPPVSTARNSLSAAGEHSPATRESSRPSTDRAEVRRFLFERVYPTKTEHTKSPEASTPSQASGLDPTSNGKPEVQMPFAQDNRESRASVPQQAANSRPSRSTTSFASNSLPLWHVSAPTGIVAPSRTATPDAAARRLPSSPTATTAEPASGSSSGSPVSQSTRKTGTPEHRDVAVQESFSAQDRLAASSDNSLGLWSANKAANAPENDSRPAEARIQLNSVYTPKGPSRFRSRLFPPETKPQEKWRDHRDADDKNNVRNTLRSKLKQWLNPGGAPSDRRRSERRYVPGMVAHYFTGGAPRPHQVADISLTGFYLLTEDRWMTGTMIQMTVQKPSRDGGKKSITVLSRVVRRGSDGVGAEFVMPESIDAHNQDIQRSQATDRAALARFL